MIGEYVSVHFPDGCKIGMVVSETDTTKDISFGEVTITDIPKKYISAWVK